MDKTFEQYPEHLRDRKALVSMPHCGDRRHLVFIFGRKPPGQAFFSRAVPRSLVSPSSVVGAAAFAGTLGGQKPSGDLLGLVPLEFSRRIARVFCRHWVSFVFHFLYSDIFRKVANGSVGARLQLCANRLDFVMGTKGQ